MRKKEKTELNRVDENSVIDEIYIETGDLLRNAKLNECAILAEISNFEKLLEEENRKTDPNRNLFHTFSERELSAETDMIRVQLHDKKKELDNLRAEIDKIEERMKQLHQIRKQLFTNQIEVPDIAKSKIEITEEPISEGIAVQSLTTMLHKAELIERLIDVDRERAKLEIMDIKQLLQEQVDKLKIHNE